MAAMIRSSFVLLSVARFCRTKANEKQEPPSIGTQIPRKKTPTHSPWRTVFLPMDLSIIYPQINSFLHDTHSIYNLKILRASKLLLHYFSIFFETKTPLLLLLLVLVGAALSMVVVVRVSVSWLLLTLLSMFFVLLDRARTSPAAATTTGSPL